MPLPSIARLGLPFLAVLSLCACATGRDMGAAAGRFAYTDGAERAEAGKTFQDIGYATWSDDEPAYRLYPGDELDIAVPSAPELNKTVVIQPDGRVSLPLVGPVMVADRTTLQAQDALDAAYSSQLRRPEVYVTVKTAGPLKIFVGGEVDKPGVYDMPGDINALQAVIQAGNFKTTAKREQVVIIRRGPDGRPMMRTVNLKQGLATPGRTDLVPLRRSDIVYVPRTGLASAGILMKQIEDLVPGNLTFDYAVTNSAKIFYSPAVMNESDLDAWLRDMPGEPHPFPTSPRRLYSPADIYEGFDPLRPGSLPACFDARVAGWLTHGGLAPRKLSVGETIAARLHDTAIDRLVAAFVMDRRPSVAMMGSHSISRADPSYLQFALIARDLRRRGHLVISGGGPGLMEAANLGAFLAPCEDAALEESLEILGRSPLYEDGEAWVRSAAEARALALRRMKGGDPDATWTSEAPEAAWSLGLPTWYYSQEWPNLFASHLGKYFFNSLREDGLVSVATAGIVFGMGEAGTVQEVFQNASLNYYRQDGRAPTPMVFVGKAYWSSAPGESGPAGKTVDRLPKPVLPLIRAMAVEAGAPFDGAVQAYDSVKEVVEAIVRADCEAAGPGCIAESRLAAVEP